MISKAYAATAKPPVSFGERARFALAVFWLEARVIERRKTPRVRTGRSPPLRARGSRGRESKLAPQPIEKAGNGLANGASSRPPGGLALFQERAKALDRIGFGEIVDHRKRGDRIGLVERLFDLGVEGALADRQRRARMLRDCPGQPLRF